MTNFTFVCIHKKPTWVDSGNQGMWIGAAISGEEAQTLFICQSCFKQDTKRIIFRIPIDCWVISSPRSFNMDDEGLGQILNYLFLLRMPSYKSKTVNDEGITVYDEEFLPG